MNEFRIFTWADVPVYVSPFFVLLLGYYGFMSGFTPETLSFIIVVTLSLLVHEFGHALVARHYKLSPEVVLHGFGGFCRHQRSKSDRHDIYIIIAGPGVGIAVAMLVWGLEVVLNMAAPEAVAARPLLTTIFWYSFYVGIIWNVVNLIPLWPLDGGQLFRIGLVRWLGPVRGERITHITGTALGVLTLLLAIASGSMLLMLICAMLAWQNIRQLRSGTASGPIRRRNTFAHELHTKARKALQQGDNREAARLGHQARAEGNLSDDLLDQLWELLAIATARLGEHKEALGYAKRAPNTPLTLEARIRSHIGLGQHEQAREILDSPQVNKLPSSTLNALRDLLFDRDQLTR
ncbi:MAG: site-2 protease family protein [Myxococcota bacterium]